MDTSALITMVIVHVTVTAFTGYFFYRVLTMKPKGDDLTEAEDEE